MSLVRWVTGIIKLRGNSDGTKIGNVSDSIKANITASALPAGGATEAKQDTGNTSLGNIDTKVSTAAKQDTGNASLGSIDTKLTDNATSAKQDTGNTSLGNIDTKVSTAAKQDTAQASLTSIDGKLSDNATATNQSAIGVILSSIDTKVSTAAKQDIGNTSLSNIDGKVSTEAKQDTLLDRVGIKTETSPASDTASSGLNGRLQRIAQRISSMIAVLPSVIGTAWFTRISDGTEIANISPNNDLQTSDTLRVGGIQGVLTVGVAAVELKVGGSKLANRKTCGLDNGSNSTIYWGYTNAVTTTTGRRIYKNQNDAEWGVSDGASIWLIAGSAGNVIRVNESG